MTKANRVHSTPRRTAPKIKPKPSAVSRVQKSGFDLVQKERVERAIADDVAFLAAHPTKKSKPMSTEAKVRRRNFKEAMRRRIKDIAASRDIPDYEIRPVLSLRHRHIGEFVEKHGVNLEWLLEGKGRIFKKDPIAAVVATIPEADEQAIRTMVREILQERDQ
jgi:hypothetical protein